MKQEALAADAAEALGALDDVHARLQRLQALWRGVIAARYSSDA